MTRQQRTCSNHFVPQAYLRRWSDDGYKVWWYATLVPSAAHREWRHTSIRGLARLMDLYTSSVGGTESDTLEKWLHQEIEIPSDPVFEEVLADAPLSRAQWEVLIRYVAALDLRTPTDFLETMARWNVEIPRLLEQTLDRGRKDLEKAGRKGRLPAVRPDEHRDAEIPLRVALVEEDGGMAMQAEITMGRLLWHHRIRLLMNRMVPTLLRHNWSIVKPHSGMEWFTSDHPVIRLNYHADGKYDFRGGWGSPGSEILVPLSPQHLLYTQIGKPQLRAPQLTREGTFRIQSIIAQRAYRRVFARAPLPRVRWFRPRVVNLSAYRAEEDRWRRFHMENSAVEQSIRSRDP